MRKRTIAAALVAAAPFLALLSPQAAACWGTGYGYTATTAAAPVAPRRYGYMSYGYIRLPTMVATVVTTVVTVAMESPAVSHAVTSDVRPTAALATVVA